MNDEQENSNQEDFPYYPLEATIAFPDPEESDDGIVCLGGNFSPGVLKSAYLQGIFPWYNEDTPILWWCPDPRFVLFPEELHISKSLKKFLRQNKESSSPYTFTINKAFDKVIDYCAKIQRPDQDSTWITEPLAQGYKEFHREGLALSVETWQEGNLIGGLYGVLIGSIFFGESMFTLKPNAAKAAFVQFVQAFRQVGGKLIDSQIYTDNIARFGGRNISRSAFLRLEDELLYKPLCEPITEELLNHF
ncbi:MAG: leucyl/phenylalanyl-tRNA--protein transferase [Spirochaetaceae bacterium]|nr:leucyl/phenylalanyl-tRNA--protein transferase [Spirochaetaceae bacterium]